ncbi:MAG: hypothetical protein ACRCWJ_10020, partial [Casimicrobium sp.]
MSGLYPRSKTISRACARAIVAATLALIGLASTARAAPGDLDQSYGTQGTWQIDASGGTSSAQLAQRVFTLEDMSSLVVGTCELPGGAQVCAIRVTRDGVLDSLRYGNGGRFVNNWSVAWRRVTYDIDAYGRILIAADCDDKVSPGVIQPYLDFCVSRIT